MSTPAPLVVPPEKGLLVLEGEGIAAASKPSGEPVIAARGAPAEACLRRRLEQRLERRLWVVHRIDRDASGLVLFALTAQAHRALSLSFEHRQVAKTYRAYVAGELSPGRGRLEVALHPARKGKTRPAAPAEAGQPATTEYETRRTWSLGRDRISLVEAHPLTGRHHQIRVHLRSAGAPILFDPLYALGRTPAAVSDAPCSRLALHALRIDVPDLRGTRRLVIEAPLAPDLVALEGWLDEHAT